MKSFTARFRPFMLFLGDVGCLLFGIFAALSIRYGYPIPSEKIDLHQTPFIIIFVVWLVSFYAAGLYNLRNAKNERTFFTSFFAVFGINTLIAILFFYFVPYFSITPKVVLFLDLGITLAMLLFWRIFFNGYVSLPPLKLGILGEGPEVNELIDDLLHHPQQGYKCVYHAANAHSALSDLLRSKKIDVVAVAIDYRSSPELQKSLFECIPLHIQFFDFVDFYEQRLQKIPLAVIDRAWFLENLNEPEKQFFGSVKRATDIFIAVIVGIIGGALLPFISFAIWMETRGPVFYSQMRVGQFGKPFRIYKFRSMNRSDDKQAVTYVGRFLRATHLDEIPQLWNIFLGEMSFVGPRPEQPHFVEELKEKIPFYAERLLVRPGITGWAQLHEPRARAEDGMEKLQYDLFYVKHRTLILDFEIILKTIKLLVA